MEIVSFKKDNVNGDELILSFPNEKTIRIADTGNGSFNVYDDTPMSKAYSVYVNSGCSVYFTPAEEIQRMAGKTEE